MIKLFSSKYFFLVLLSSSLAFSSSAVYAVDKDQQEVSELLTKNNPPDGVVFELIGSGAGKYLLNALKKVTRYKAQLQKKFPELDIAVVSHGSEQFGLTTVNQSKAKKAHSYAQQLVASDVPVHICEAHARWRRVKPSEFPEYISVSSSGPTQITEYQELGYTLVVVK